MKYVSHNFTDGDACTLTGEPRTAEVLAWGMALDLDTDSWSPHRALFVLLWELCDTKMRPQCNCSEAASCGGVLSV